MSKTPLKIMLFILLLGTIVGTYMTYIKEINGFISQQWLNPWKTLLYATGIILVLGLIVWVTRRYLIRDDHNIGPVNRLPKINPPKINMGGMTWIKKLIKLAKSLFLFGLVLTIVIIYIGGYADSIKKGITAHWLILLIVGILVAAGLVAWATKRWLNRDRDEIEPLIKFWEFNFPKINRGVHFEHFDFKSFGATLFVTIVLIVICASIGIGLKIQGLWLVALVVTGIYIWESIQTIKPGEIAALVFLGKPYKTVKSGVVYAPLGLMKVIREDGRIREEELPAEPDKIWRGKPDNENAPPPPGYKPPIRILFGKPNKEIKDDPYNARIVAEVPIFVSYQVEDMELWLENMGSHKKAVKNIEDMAIALFNIEFSKNSPSAVVAGLDEYSKKLKKALDKNTHSWGIAVRVARIKPIIFSHSLNKAVTRVSESVENAKTTRTTAEAERDKLTQEGQGVANARFAFLTAEADGLLLSLTKKAEGTEALRKLIAEQGGLDALQLETLIDALKGGNNTFLSGGDGLMQSLLGAIQTAKNINKEKS